VWLPKKNILLVEHLLIERAKKAIAMTRRREGCTKPTLVFLPIEAYFDSTLGLLSSSAALFFVHIILPSLPDSS
jgi:hypothetical protein